MVLVPVHELAAWQAAGRLVGKVSEILRRSRRVELPPEEFYVTELLRCPLQSWLDRVKPATETLEASLVYTMGMAVHEVFERAARELGLRVEERVEVGCTFPEVKLRITGRADIYDPRERVVYEVKTVSPPDPRDAAGRSDFRLQVLFYRDALRASRAVLVLVSRSSGEVYAVEVGGEPGEAVSKLCRRAIMLHRHLKSGEPPPCNPGPWCGLCPYRSVCPCASGSWGALEEYLKG